VTDEWRGGVLPCPLPVQGCLLPAAPFPGPLFPAAPFPGPLFPAALFPAALFLAALLYYPGTNSYSPLPSSGFCSGMLRVAA